MAHEGFPGQIVVRRYEQYDSMFRKLLFVVAVRLYEYVYN